MMTVEIVKKMKVKKIDSDKADVVKQEVMWSTIDIKTKIIELEVVYHQMG